MKINGIATTIQNEGADKLAVILPGYLETKDYPSLIALADELNKIDYQTICFDPTGTWESDGKIEDYCITKYLDDLDKIINYAKEKSGPFKEIILCGQSMGGQVAFLYACRRPGISKVVAIMSALDPAKNPYTISLMDKWIETGLRYSKRDLPNDSAKHREFQVPYSFYEDRQNYCLEKELNNFKGKKIMLAAEKDIIVLPENVKELFDMADDPKEFRIIPGIGHDYRKNPDEIKLVNKTIIEVLTDGK